MIFLKHFDAITQSLLGVGKVHLPRVCKMSDLIPIINDRMKWAPGTPLKLYEVTNGAFPPARRANLASLPRKSNLA